jgi:hypothetical protein
MADFSLDKKYNYLWQNSKFKDFAQSGSLISQFVNDAGYVTSTSGVDTGSFVTTSSFNAYTGSSSSQFAGTASLALTASYFSGSVSNAISASYALTASYAQNLVISGSINNVDYIDFTTDNIIGTNAPAWKEGRLFYDSGSGALAMYNWEQDVTLNIGQEQWLRARNQTGTLITNGSVVRLLGAIGDRPTIALAQAVDQTNTFSVSNEIIGMATHDIEHGTDGFVTTFGLVNGINTDAFEAGDILWVSQSAGQFTNIPPSPPIDRTFVGIVTRKNVNNGTVFMTPLTPIHFHDISSVSASIYQMGDLWMYRSGSVGQANAWINTKALTGSYSISGSLNATSFTGSLSGTASYATQALSASFASTVPASGVIGLNLTQIATSSFSASVSPTQFTVTSASITEFTVTGTGVILGNALTDTHRITGSANITGSLTVVGPTTSTQIGAGAAPSGSVRLDVRAQGALSTDIALRVRNSTDTYNMLAVQGDGNIQIGSDAVGTTRTTTIGAINTSQLVLDTSFSTNTATIGVSRRITPLYNTNTLLFTQNSFSDGNVQPYKFHFVNPSTYWGYNQAGWTVIYDAGYMWHKDSATFANLQMKLTPDNVLTVYTGSVTPSGPTGTSAIPTEANITGSAFQLWASGSAGNAQPYFKTQNGTIVWLGTQSRLFNVTASNITASSVISSFTGSLTGSVTNYETAWTPYTPIWTAASVDPVIGNGTIEGWYKVIGKTCFVRGNIAMGSTTTFGSGEWYVSMPFTASHADAILMSANLLDNGSAWYNALLNGARAGFNFKAAIQYQNTGGTTSDVNATQPFTWANSDRFLWNGTYELI